MKQDKAIGIESLLKEYKTDAVHGLSADEVQQRVAQWGPNALPEAKPETWLSVFIRQFRNPLTYMLFAAAFIILCMSDDKLDAFIISGVLIFNAIIGTIQERRTGSILHSLKQFIKTSTIVLRDGKKKLVEDADLTVGDIILLQEGERVPADAYVIEAHYLQIDESILTGESKPVFKSIDIAATVPGSDAPNIVYKGTYVLSGSGKALVFAIGSHTAVGKIHGELESIQSDTPLKQEVDRLSYWILIGVILLCIGLFSMGFLAGQPLRELMVMLTGLFICVVPEGLPVVMTLVLVTGVYRMAKHNVLVKHMQAVEGLGRTHVIAIDKTGTLTRNELMVTKVMGDGIACTVSGQGYYVEGKVTCNNETIDRVASVLYPVGVASALLNSTEVTYQALRHTFDIKGDPTEAAMAIYARKIGLEKDDLLKEYTLLYELPFDSDRQYHAGFFDHHGQGILYLIGSPEIMFHFAQQVSDEDRAHLKELLEDGLRVVAVASKQFDRTLLSADMGDVRIHEQASNILQQGAWTLHGLVGIQDAIRTEVPDMVQKARNAGLSVVMMTGDHLDTALYVAKKVGIFASGNKALVGQEVKNLSDEQLLASLEDVTVYARLLPQQKMRLITLFHKKKTIIAMTGDGINDAPALIAADLGIAMGGIGTEVAKSAADIILLNDSFANIISAIEEGRHIFYTLKRVILYFFSTNMGEVLIVLFALGMNVFGFDFPLPLTAAQILWLNLVTDGFLDISLSMEPQEQGLLRKKWLTEEHHLVDSMTLLKMLFYAVPMALGSLWVFMYYYRYDVQLARTMTLLCMAMFQWFNAWNCRSVDQSLLTIGLFSNRWLVIATSFVLSLQFLLIYAPPMQYIFKTVPLSVSQWALIIAISFPILIFDEMRKFLVRRLWPET